jgi:hypothetical protein
MTSVGFEPTVSAFERPQTHALDSAATGTGLIGKMFAQNISRDLHRTQEPPIELRTARCKLHLQGKSPVFNKYLGTNP